MSLRWCAFTGALMLGFVWATFLHESVTDEPGVTTRWWDGTAQLKETRHSNGTPATRTAYGDDGKTVISNEEWLQDGTLVRSSIRQKDGRVERKEFFPDGKFLQSYTLWNADGLTFVLQRHYHVNGNILREVIMTEDGLVPTQTRQFDKDGSGALIQENRILDNAEQQEDFYVEGKVRKHSLWRINGDQLVERFYASGKLSTRETSTRLTGQTYAEGFTEDGKLVFRKEPLAPDPPSTLDNLAFPKYLCTVYEGDKVKLKQVLGQWWLADRVEEFSLETGLVTRRLITHEGELREVELYRKDGTLERVKTMNSDSTVQTTTEYDTTGKKIASEKEGGEPEVIDETVLQDASLRFRLKQGGD